MVYSEPSTDPLYLSLLPVVEGCGLSLVEFTLSRHKGSVTVRLVIFKAGGVGVNDCSAVHRAIQGRIQLAFPENDIYIEVSSAGISRTIKDASEFRYYIGQEVRCYIRAASDWSGGILESADTKQLTLRTPEGELTLPYADIAKAKLET
jgi:ribosome maturation factor RimP